MTRIIECPDGKKGFETLIDLAQRLLPKQLVSARRQRIFIRRNGSSAFTLLELLAVMAILAILAALLLPTIAQAKKKAQRTQCASNLHQISVALHGYLAETQAYPISVYWLPLLGRQEGLGFQFTKGVWLCPSAKWYTNRIYSVTHLNWPVNSYAYNAFGLANHPQSLGLGGQTVSVSQPAPPTRDSDVAEPSDMMAIGDCLFPGILWSRQSLERLEEYGAATERHRARSNVAFCDGHVECPTIAFTYTDTSDEALSRWNRDHEPHRDLLPP